MNSKLTFRSFTLVTALTAAISSIQLAALPEQADNTPSPGMVFIYTDRAWKVEKVEGRLISFSHPLGRFGMYATLVDEPRNGLRYDTGEVDKLFPLSVGKAVEFPIFIQDPRHLKTTITVTAQERVRVPAGEFDAFVIEMTEQVRPWTDGKIKKTTKWYAPALGTFVKAQFPDGANIELFAIDDRSGGTTKYDGAWSGTLTTTENISGKCFSAPVPVAFNIEGGRLKDLSLDNTPKNHKFYGSLTENGQIRGAWISVGKDEYVMSLVDAVVSDNTITLRYANKSCVSKQVLKRS